MKSLWSWRCSGLGDDLRPAILAVLVSLHQNGNLWLIPRDSASMACLPWNKEETCTLRPPGAHLALVVMAHVIWASWGSCIDLSKLLRGSWRRLAVLLSKLGRTRPSMEPRGGLQVGRTGYPQVQDSDNYQENKDEGLPIRHHMCLILSNCLNALKHLILIPYLQISFCMLSSTFHVYSSSESKPVKQGTEESILWWTNAEYLTKLDIYNNCSTK